NVRPFAGGRATSPSAVTAMTSTFFPGTADVSAAQPVTVQSGETVNDLTIQLVTVPSFQVSGMVVGKGGNPVADARVILWEAAGTDSLLALIMGPRGMSQSDTSGRFVLGGIPA